MRVNGNFHRHFLSVKDKYIILFLFIVSILYC